STTSSYGGSRKTKLARAASSGFESNQCTTSPRTTRVRSFSARAFKVWRRIVGPRSWRSTKVTLAAPRQRASMPSAPEPANRSSTCASSTSGPTMLKIAALTRLCVGRMPFGILSRLPRDSPPPTRSRDIELVEVRPARAPGPRLLELRREAKDDRLAARRADQLDADRQPVAVDTEWQRDRGLAGAVERVGEADEVHVLVAGGGQVDAQRVEPGHGAGQGRRDEHVVVVPEADHQPAVHADRVDRPHVIHRGQPPSELDGLNI